MIKSPKMLCFIGPKLLFQNPSPIPFCSIVGTLGGVAGFLVGPAIGKVIANALGIEKGIIYDMLTSRLATAALGAALTKYMGKKK
jgi:hypothetical protein